MVREKQHQTAACPLSAECAVEKGAAAAASGEKAAESTECDRECGELGFGLVFVR